MRNKIVGIVILMLVATTVVSATNIDLKKNIQTIASRDILSFNNKIEIYQPVDFNWGMFNWGVDQKQTKTDRYGITLYPPDTNAQSFTPTKDKLTAVSLYIFRFGAPPEPVQITVSIRDNLSGSDLATKTIDTSVVKINKSTWVLFDFEDIPVTPGNKYYIVCQGTAGNPTNAYCWLYSFNDTYPRGDAWYKANEGSSWIQWPNGPQSPKDFCFKTYFRKPIDVSSTPKTNENMAPENYEVNVPVWAKGDSWTYRESRSQFTYNENGTYSTFFFNCTTTYTVTDTTGDTYTMKMTSKENEGRLTMGTIRLLFTHFFKFSQEIKIRKTDLAWISNTYQWKGPVFWLIGTIGLPLPAQHQVIGENINTPPMTMTPFPLIAGTNGSLPQIHHTGFEKASLYWGLKVLEDMPNVSWYTVPFTYTCDMTDITVPAGTYSAYNVTAIHDAGNQHDYYRTYYVQEVGNFVIQSFNLDWDMSGRPYWTQEIELVSTTYTP